MIQKAAGNNNWWLSASSWQWAHSWVMSHAELFGKTSNHPGDSASQQPRFGSLQLLAFPQTKITFEREEISDCQWSSGKYDGATYDDWESCVRFSGAYFEGDWGVIVICTMFLVFSSINVSIFHITWLDTFWTEIVNRIMQYTGFWAWFLSPSIMCLRFIYVATCMSSSFFLFIAD